jgi:hypothetical protein
MAFKIEREAHFPISLSFGNLAGEDFAEVRDIGIPHVFFDV